MITCSLSSFLDTCLSSHVVQKFYIGIQVWERHIVTLKQNWIGKFMNYGR
jgi:hypothetical protein